MGPDLHPVQLAHAGVILLPADGGVPSPDDLIATATATVTTGGYRLIEGLFECQDLGPHTLKGISTF